MRSQNNVGYKFMEHYEAEQSRLLISDRKKRLLNSDRKKKCIDSTRLEAACKTLGRGRGT